MHMKVGNRLACRYANVDTNVETFNRVSFDNDLPSSLKRAKNGELLVLRAVEPVCDMPASNDKKVPF
jgi:hypothetical protein